MTPPAVEVRLEYPRQTNATTSYNDINNFGDRKISSVAESLAAEPNASTSATLSFLQRLESGDKLKATITKSNQGSSNYNSYGINNLTLYFIQD